MINRDGLIQVYNNLTKQHEGLHPETNWEQVKVSKEMNLREYLQNDAYAAATIKHNKNRIPFVQCFYYDYGAGVGTVGEQGAGGTDPIVNSFIGIRHLDSNTTLISISIVYKKFGDISVTKNPKKDEYYITFANSEKCIGVILM